MGRSRKAKKPNVSATREDLGSGEEEKLPVKRRGRPLKSLKNEIQEEEKEVEKLEVDDDDTNGVLSDKNVKSQVLIENGKKRKRASEIKENGQAIKEENDVDTKTKANDVIKPIGFRQNGSRRKNKPRRAAEVGVECCV